MCDYRFLSKLVLECNFFPKTIGRQKGSEATVQQFNSSISVSKSLKSLWKVLHHVSKFESLLELMQHLFERFLYPFVNGYHPCAFEELRCPNSSPYAAFISSSHRSTTDILSSHLKSLSKLITCPEITVIIDSYQQI